MNNSKDSEKEAPPCYRELDWFEFETRMRQLICEMIEPSTERQKDDRILIDDLTRTNNRLKKRIKKIETMLGMSNNSSTLRQEFKTQIAEIESQRAANQVVVDQRFNELQQFISHNATKIFESQIEIVALTKENKSSKEEIERFNQLVDKNLQITNGRMLEVSSETYTLVEKIRSEFEICNNDTQENSSKISEILKRLNETNTNIEGLHKAMRDMKTKFLKLKQDKLNRAELDQYSSQVELRLIAMSDDTDAIRGEMKEIERYLDSYLPLETQAYISDNFYSCLDRPQHKKFVNYEISKYKNLQNSYAEIRTDVEVLKLMNRAIAEGRRAEHRKNDFLQEMKKLEKFYKSGDEEKLVVEDNAVPSKIEFTKEGVFVSPARSIQPSRTKILKHESSDQSISTISQATKIASVTVNVEELQDQFSQYKEEEKRNYIDFATEVRNTVNEQLTRVRDDIRRIKEDMYRGDEENKIYVQMLCEKEDRNELSDKKMSSEMKVLYDEIQRQGAITSRLKKENITFTELIACVVEFCLICHNLLSQDEDDRQGLQLTGFKDEVKNALPSIDRKKNLAVNGECLSCSGNTKAIPSGFKMACLPYNPTPLKYRNSIYTRPQLLELMGNMIQSCWARVSLKPPYDKFPNISYNEPMRKKKKAHFSRTLNNSTHSVPPIHLSVETSSYTSQNTLINLQ
jgi:hypothetical protein